MTQELTRMCRDRALLIGLKTGTVILVNHQFLCVICVHLSSDPGFLVLKLCNVQLSQQQVVAQVQDHKMSCWNIWEEDLLLAR